MAIFSEILFIGLVVSSTDNAQPDFNFKSMHRLEYEIHQNDTLQSDTFLHSEVTSDSTSRQRGRVRPSIFLYSVVVTILIIAAVLFLLFRRRHRVRGE